VTKASQIFLHVIVLVALLWLAGCVAPLGAGGGGPGSVLGRSAQPTAADLLARRAVPLSPTPTLRPTATRTLQPDLAATQLAAANLQEPVATVLNPPTEAPVVQLEFQICSPLDNILREDLPRLVSDGYAPPPRLRPDDRHHGVDFAYYHWKGGGPIAGTEVQSVLAGRVAMALEDTFPYGNVVIVETPREDLPEELIQSLELPQGQSLYLLYAHLQEESLQVQVNDPVSACQSIGAVGRTGNTKAYHLHLETRSGPPGLTLTGMSAFTDTASDEEKRNYRMWRISGKYQHFDPMRLLLYGFEIAQPTAAPVKPSKDEDG
jgi:murein DD-endopeptidase MepM/ murein hydrolase activator NlpD